MNISWSSTFFYNICCCGVFFYFISGSEFLSITTSPLKKRVKDCEIVWACFWDIELSKLTADVSCESLRKHTPFVLPAVKPFDLADYNCNRNVCFNEPNLT